MNGQRLPFKFSMNGSSVSCNTGSGTGDRLDSFATRQFIPERRRPARRQDADGAMTTRSEFKASRLPPDAAGSPHVPQPFTKYQYQLASESIRAPSPPEIFHTRHQSAFHCRLYRLENYQLTMVDIRRSRMESPTAFVPGAPAYNEH